MSLRDINHVAAPVLACYPRGTPRSAQNVFRMVLQNILASSLGKRRPWKGSIADCVGLAEAFTREHWDAAFVPLSR